MRRPAVLLLFLSICLSARSQTALDTLSYTPSNVTDTTLAAGSIFEIMPRTVRINQSRAVESAMASHVRENAGKMILGYRIRIYYESGQNSRVGAVEAVQKFKMLFPDISVRHVYNNPYFIVNVGDFRSRLDAENALSRIREEFPDAMIVRDRFKYPSLK